MEIPILGREELYAKWKHVLDATEGIFTWTSGHELAWLAECASKATSIVEIGSYHGKSAKVMSLANPNCHIHCIDTFDDAGTEFIFRKNLSTEISSGQLYVIKGNSNLVTSMDYDPQYDFAFIDGGHLYLDVLKDIQNISPYILKGSFISGHDWDSKDMRSDVNMAVLEVFRPRIFESIWFAQL